MKKFSASHGNHNDSILDEEMLHKALIACVNNGVSIFDNLYKIKSKKNKLVDGRLGVLSMEGDPIDFHAHLIQEKDGEQFNIASFFPVINDGTEVEVTIEEIFEDPDYPAEGTIQARLNGRRIYYFDPYYYINKKNYIIGEKVKISLTGFLYNFRALTDDEKEFEVDWDENRRKEMGMELEYDENGKLKPVVFNATKMNAFFASTDFYGDFEFQSEIKSYEIIRFAGEEILKLGIEYYIEGESIPLNGYLRMGKVNMNDVVIGEAVRGIIYFQGTLCERTQEFDWYDKEEYHLLRIVGEAHQSISYERLFENLADNCVFENKLNDSEIKGKKNIIKYYKGKEKPIYCFYEIIKCGLDIGLDICQFFEGSEGIDEVHMFIDHNEKKEITKIILSESRGKCFKSFMLPYTFENKSKGDKWYPLYEEDNLLNEQELNFFACHFAAESLEECWGFKVQYVNCMLSCFPNIVAEKDGKITYFTVRGRHTKELPGFGEKDEEKLYEENADDQNLPPLCLRRFCNNIAMQKKANYNIIQVHFKSAEGKHFEKGEFYRGEDYYHHPVMFETGDFDC